MGDTTICLTGTINPATGQLNRSDVELRLNDYKTSIEFYLSRTEWPLIFAENSDYDLSGDEDFDRFLQNPRFTCLRWDSHPTVDRGKGFQEFYLLDRMVENLPAGSRFAKITGRYKVHNFDELIRRSDSLLNIDMHRKMKVAITGFFIADRALYLQHFKGLYAKADDRQGRFIEHVLYESITSDPALQSVTALLPENPAYEGISGSYGQSLRRNPYKMMVRGVERSVSRALGIRKFLIEY